MVLASDTALNLDPETLESSWGEEFCPKGVLKIFLPDLKKSSLYRKKGDAGKEAFPMMPFSFLLHGENHQGISGMILKVFLVWAEFLNEYFSSVIYFFILSKYVVLLLQESFIEKNK